MADNGGGVGGPIAKNKTFFWSSVEKYINNQPQQNSFLVPTTAERGGDFSRTRRNGALDVIRDPLTGVAFPGNVIPAQPASTRSAQKIMSYMPTAGQRSRQRLVQLQHDRHLPNKAYQQTTKLEHHSATTASISGFWLNQATHEASPTTTR